MSLTASIAFSLHVTVGYGSDKGSVEALNKACMAVSPSLGIFSGTGFFGASNNTSLNNGIFVASASNVNMSMDAQAKPGPGKIPTLAAVFVPPAMIECSLEKFTASSKSHASGSCFWIQEAQSARLSKDLLPRIHPAFSRCKIRGMILTSIAAEQNAPAEFIILDLLGGGTPIAQLLSETNCRSLADNPDIVIKLIPISSISFSLKEHPDEAIGSLSSPSLPTCPVCIHRIDPGRLGLPAPSNEHLCSKFCPAPSFIGGSWVSESSDSCPKQRFLRRWPLPSRCSACQVIHHYWNQLKRHDEATDLFCAECAMHKTLWVCLTCGFVGCGRYSNKHSVAHFEETGHPYSLELATLRIW